MHFELDGLVVGNPYPSQLQAIGIDGLQRQLGHTHSSR